LTSIDHEEYFVVTPFRPHLKLNNDKEMMQRNYRTV
jgi:hypothetical protein